MNAVIFFYLAGDFEEQHGKAKDQFDDILAETSSLEWVIYAAIAVFVVACMLGFLYAVFRYVLPRGTPAAPTNTVAESMGAIFAFLVLGNVIGEGLRHLGVKGIVTSITVSALILLAAAVGLGVMGRLREGGTPFRWWDLGFCGLGSLLLVVPVAFAVFVPIHVVGAIVWRLFLVACNLDAPLQGVLEEPLRQGGIAVPLVFVLAVTVVPVLEETIFRGAFYRSLRSHAGVLPSALLSAIVFSACHFNLGGFLPILVLAVFLAVAYEWTGSLWAPIIIHSLFNMVNYGLA